MIINLLFYKNFNIKMKYCCNSFVYYYLEKILLNDFENIGKKMVMIFILLIKL